MSALCFKLFRLSYSVLTFKSLKAKIHLLSWNHLLFMCIICTFWMQTKNTTESLLERPGVCSPLFRCQSYYSEMCSICLVMLPHKVHSPDKNPEKLSWMPLGLLSASWSFFLPLQEARSVGASVESPVDIQKVNVFTFFCLAFLSIDFFSVVFALSLLLFLVNKKRSPSINNWGDLGCTPFKVLKLFYKPNCLNAGGLTAVMTCSSIFLL